MKTETLPLAGWRNAGFPPDVFAFASDGAPVDLTLKSLSMDVRAVAGEGAALISLDTTNTEFLVNGIFLSDAVAGEITIQIDQPAMKAAWDAAYAAGLMKAGEPAPLVYDLRVEDEDGFAEVWLEGPFIINPGVTL